MSDWKPTPDDAIPDEISDRLEDQPRVVLRAVADYAIALADARGDDAASGEGDGNETAGTSQDGESDTEESVVVEDGDLPDGVPGKASITVKEINENRYYYWQWRDGDAVKSKYHGPVDSGS
jgi:hypothetical protein